MLGELSLKALIVDSSNTMRSVLRRILAMRGFVVTAVDNVQEAVDFLHRSGSVDLVMLDWDPRNEKELELVARLRRAASDRTLVVMLTGIEPGIRKLHKASLAGVDEYLVKPFTSGQLDEKLMANGRLPKS
jgi:two-component system chemotaxis response regulator CheY